MANIKEDFEVNGVQQDIPDNIINWYQMFQSGDLNSVSDNQNENSKKASALAELLLYSVQLKAYADFVGQMAASIENDVKTDIMNDIRPVEINPQAAVVTPPVWQALRYAANNKENLVKASESISQLVNGVNSILGKVKFKDE